MYAIHIRDGDDAGREKGGGLKYHGLRRRVTRKNWLGGAKKMENKREERGGAIGYRR